MIPFAALGGAYDSALAKTETLSAGPGLSLRQYFRGDSYTAPQSYVDLSVQYRFRLAGDDRSKGVAVNLTFSY